VECFIHTFGKEAIHVVLGDREFIGKYWINYLIDNDISYVFRLKEEGQYISNSRGKMIKIRDLCARLQPGETVGLGMRKVGKVEKMPLHCTAHRSKKGELVVVVHTVNIQQPIVTYAIRWGIETMFKAFKSSGFDMESTHITHPDRLHTLFAVMAIAFCVACKTGEICANEQPIPIKKHGRKAQSTFRIGLDAIKNALANLPVNIRYSTILLHWKTTLIPIKAFQNQKIVRY
jgi:hypothetical protein